MKCPLCDGKCGFWDYFGEWLDCSLCKETGRVSTKQRRQFFEDIKRVDTMIEKEFAAMQTHEATEAK